MISEVVSQRRALSGQRRVSRGDRVVGVAVLRAAASARRAAPGAQHGFMRLGEVVEVGDDVLWWPSRRRTARACARGRTRSGCRPTSSRRSGGTTPSPARTRCRGGAGSPCRTRGSHRGCRTPPVGAADCEPGHVGAEVDEVAGDRERGVGGDKEPVGLAADVAVLQPEDLGDGDRLVVAVVGEDAEDDTEVRRRRAALPACAAGGLVPLGLVVA